ncbi:hypothetical protein RRG08_023663 [Elysia crispata]|uniref:Uncharacterized protein n=1 Tax=Elysia crispata TaxID=231223 RepID=A0AAE0XSJ4_9GAST|nr:hypothetical protein RRG08_023663 [Elysia crispata]
MLAGTVTVLPRLRIRLKNSEWSKRESPRGTGMRYLTVYLGRLDEATGQRSRKGDIKVVTPPEEFPFTLQALLITRLSDRLSWPAMNSSPASNGALFPND